MWSDHDCVNSGHGCSCDLTMTMWTVAHVIWPWLCEQWPQVLTWSDHDHVNSGHRCSCDRTMTVWMVATGAHVIWSWLCEQWPQVFMWSDHDCENSDHMQVLMWSDHDCVNGGHKCSCDLTMTVWSVATGFHDQALHKPVMILLVIHPRLIISKKLLPFQLSCSTWIISVVEIDLICVR